MACLCMYYNIISFRFYCLFTPATIHSVFGMRRAANDIARLNDVRVDCGTWAGVGANFI